MNDHASARHYAGDALSLQPDASGARFWAVALAHAMLSYFEVPPDVTFERHEHESEQITLVLEGDLTFHFDTHVVTVGAGEVVAVPGHVPHAVVAGPAGARAVDAWSPVRSEYVTVR